MDHDKQITDLVQVTRDRFLNQPLEPDDRDRDTFDLEAEFAKSAKNRSVIIPAAVVVFLAVLAVGAWIASVYTDQQSEQASVKIGSFEDLNLKDIFDTARRNKKDLEQINTQIDQLTSDSSARVAAIQQAGNSQADIAQVNDPSGAKSQAIRIQTAQKIAIEKANLAKAIAPLESQAAEVQKKIDSYDTRIGNLQKKNQKILDTQQRLNDLEKQKLINQYDARIADLQNANAQTVVRLKNERDALVQALNQKHAEEIKKLILKYNPILKDPAVVSVLNTYSNQAATYPPFTLSDQITGPEATVESPQKDFAAGLAQTQMLLSQLMKIPSENSVPSLVNALDNSFAATLVPLAAQLTYLNSVIVDRDTTIFKRSVQLSREKAQFDAELSRLDQALSSQTAWLGRWTGPVRSYVESLKDQDGLFVDLSDPLDWFVLLKTDRSTQLKSALDTYSAAVAKASADTTGKTKMPKPVNGAVVRDGLNNSELGSVSLTPTDHGWRAQLMKLNNPKRPFKPFDRLVLELPKKR